MARLKDILEKREENVLNEGISKDQLSDLIVKAKIGLTYQINYKHNYGIAQTFTIYNHIDEKGKLGKISYSIIYQNNKNKYDIFPNEKSCKISLLEWFDFGPNEIINFMK